MKRTNTARWVESAHRWQINVQKDGVRKTFTCAKPGRTGQLEAQRQQHIHGPRVFPQAPEGSILNRWHAYASANGMTTCSLYELRHTFVSIAQSLPEGQLRQLVGHSKAMDTFGVYAHQVDGQGEDTAARLDDLLDRLG